MSPIILALAFLVFAPVGPPGADAAPRAHLGSIGSAGSSGGQFNQARGVAVNQATGDVYVADGANNRVQQFSGDGDFIRAWGTDVVAGGGTGFEVCTVAAECKAGTAAGGAAGQVAGPVGLTVDQATGYIYVVSLNNRRIDVFSATGEFAGAFGWGVDTGAAQLEVCTTASTCQQGLAGSNAGQLATFTLASGPSVDPNAPRGTIYVPEQGNARVSKFRATIGGGVLQAVEFIKAFGWDVAPSAVDEEQEVRVRAAAGQFRLRYGDDITADIAYDASAAEVEAALNALPSIAAGGGSVTVSGGPGNTTGDRPYVVRFSGGPMAGVDVQQIDTVGGTLPLSGGDPVSGASVLVRAHGGNSTELESCTTASGCKAGLTGNGSGQFTGMAPAATGGSPTSSAVDSEGNVYVVSGPLNNPNNSCSTAAPCRIQKFDASTSTAFDFGPGSGPGQITNTSGGRVGDLAALDVAVSPMDDRVLVNKKTGAGTYQVFEYGSSGDLIESHPPTALVSAVTGAATSNHGLAMGPEDSLYTNLTGTSVYILGPVPDPMATMGSVTAVGPTGATFEGTVDIPSPGAPAFTTKYHFEYSKNGSDWTAVPVPDQDVGDGSPGTHSVSAVATELEPNTKYVVRLVATTGGEPAYSSNAAFSTETAPPAVPYTYTEEVTQTAADLSARVSAQGLKTTYHFEWTTAEHWQSTGEYDRRVPAFERQIGSGQEAVIVQDRIEGLRPASAYRFRVVAENAAGRTEGPDSKFETLNHCGLTDNRCFEMVSPADKGPIAGGGDTVHQGSELRFQAAPDSSKLAYVIGYGLPDASAGGEVLYQAVRGPGGWSSAQLSPAAGEAQQQRGTGAIASFTLGLAPDLRCGVVATPQRLTPDTPVETVAAGQANLYRRNADGSFTLITELAPTSGLDSPNPLSAYRLVGMSDNCDRVVFWTHFTYPGVGGAGESRLYEWSEGQLSNVGLVPGPSGEEAVPVVPGARNGWNWLRAVSGDGRQVVFSATRQISDLAGEVGQEAVFVRRGGTESIDVSKSETSIPSTTADYQIASMDGKYVFFLGNHGLTDPGTPPPSWPTGCTIATGAGCDLYRYSVSDEELELISVDSNMEDSAGPAVVGVLGASDDGERVYFAARGQLVPGEGRSYAQNVTRGSYSVYAWHTGEVAYVGMVMEGDLRGAAGVLVNPSTVEGVARWATRVTPSGKHLLFASKAPVLGFSTGAIEAYRFSAETGLTQCVSCPLDWGPSQETGNRSPLVAGSAVANLLSPPRMITEDGSRVYFIKSDRLAPGGVEGQRNLYQWKDGQVSFISTSGPSFVLGLQFGGASRSGSDVYFTTVDPLTWEDRDGRMDVYDARIGGGFPKPPPQPDPCDPLGEGACQRQSGDTQPVPARPGSSTFHGIGNATGNPPVKKKKKRKKSRGHRRQGKKKSKKGNRGRKVTTKRAGSRHGAGLKRGRKASSYRGAGK